MIELIVGVTPTATPTGGVESTPSRTLCTLPPRARARWLTAADSTPPLQRAPRSTALRPLPLRAGPAAGGTGGARPSAANAHVSAGRHGSNAVGRKGTLGGPPRPAPPHLVLGPPVGQCPNRNVRLGPVSVHLLQSRPANLGRERLAAPRHSWPGFGQRGR